MKRPPTLPFVDPIPTKPKTWSSPLAKGMAELMASLSDQDRAVVRAVLGQVRLRAATILEYRSVLVESSKVYIRERDGGSGALIANPQGWYVQTLRALKAQEDVAAYAEKKRAEKVRAREEIRQAGPDKASDLWDEMRRRG